MPRPTVTPGSIMIHLPVDVIKELQAEPRLIIKDHFLIGIPVPPEVLKNPEIMKRLQGYQLVLVPEQTIAG